MSSEQTTAEPKIEQWMIDAANEIGIDAKPIQWDMKMHFAQIIARNVPPCPRCRRLDAAIAHRDFIHVAELKAEIDR